MTNQAKRWEFVPHSEINVDGHILRRIRALVNMPQHGVQAGDFGGYVEHEENLPPKSHAWISNNAYVYGGARVYDDARVCDYAHVYDDARVCGDAQVFGGAWVFDYAQVFGGARVCGNAQVFGGAKVTDRAHVTGDAVIGSSENWVTVGPSISSCRFTTAHTDKRLGVRVNCGCFSGSLTEFAAAIEKTHCGNPQDLARYRAFHRLIMDVFDEENTNDK